MNQFNTILKNPQGHVLQTPWFETPFLDLYSKIENNTLVSPDRCYIIYNLLRLCAQKNGDVIECGVWRGGTAYLESTVIEKTNKTLYLFDTFEGMPDTVIPGTDHSYPGQFNDTNLKMVREYLKDFEHNINITPGFFPDTFENFKHLKFCFAHIDVDIYKSSKDALEFIYPRLCPGGIIIVDDYGFSVYKDACKRAFDEFFINKFEKPIVLPTGQAIIIKL